MAIAFDPANKRVILDSASVTATELYSRSADWLATDDNAKYGAVFRQVGGDDLGGGLSIPPYFFLQAPWRVRPMESSHNLTITGNLFVEGGGVPVVSTLGTFQVNVNYTVPVQAQAVSTGGSSGATAAQVWQHVIEAGISAEQIVRMLSAALLGNATGLHGNPAFTSIDGSKTRVAGTIAAGTRTITMLDGT